MSVELVIRNKGVQSYGTTYVAMSDFTSNRGPMTVDEIWFLQHPSVYTLGLSRQRQYIIDAGDIEVVETDRGGQITYHGLGQLIVYLLIDLKRKSISIKSFVHRLEQSVIEMLHAYGIKAVRRAGAPGVYVNHKKIAALGIRVRQGYSYHGLSINVDMDLLPYKGIHPCGHADLEVTQLKDIVMNKDLMQVYKDLLPMLLQQMEYSVEDASIINESGLEVSGLQRWKIDNAN